MTFFHFFELFVFFCRCYVGFVVSVVAGIKREWWKLVFGLSCLVTDVFLGYWVAVKGSAFYVSVLYAGFSFAILAAYYVYGFSYGSTACGLQIGFSLLKRFSALGFHLGFSSLASLWRVLLLKNYLMEKVVFIFVFSKEQLQ